MSSEFCAAHFFRCRPDHPVNEHFFPRIENLTSLPDWVASGRTASFLRGGGAGRGQAVHPTGRLPCCVACVRLCEIQGTDRKSQGSLGQGIRRLKQYTSRAPFAASPTPPTPPHGRTIRLGAGAGRSGATAGLHRGGTAYTQLQHQDLSRCLVEGSPPSKHLGRTVPALPGTDIRTGPSCSDLVATVSLNSGNQEALPLWHRGSTSSSVWQMLRTQQLTAELCSQAVHRCAVKYMQSTSVARLSQSADREYSFLSCVLVAKSDASKPATVGNLRRSFPLLRLQVAPEKRRGSQNRRAMFSVKCPSESRPSAGAHAIARDADAQRLSDLQARKVDEYGI